jgi:hypothetical protein
MAAKPMASAIERCGLHSDVSSLIQAELVDLGEAFARRSLIRAVDSRTR